MKFKPRKYSTKIQLDLYKAMLFPRLIEEKMLNLLRLGKISKWFSGIGQEAISAGCTLALEKDEMLFPMHRNLGVFVNRGIPLWQLFNQWEGKPSGFTKGRDRSFHFGTKEYNIAGMISHLGPQLSLAGGVALAHKINKESKVSLAFTGEGGTSQGEFHEALNVASVWQLPVIFVIENNGYGLSTPTSEQYNCDSLMDRGLGYGMKAKKIDGNNILEVYHTIKEIARKIRKSPEPYLIECETFRMRGHEEASGTKYVPQELMDEWAGKDPIANYERFLIKEGLINEEQVQTIKTDYKQHILDQIRDAEEYEDVEVVTMNEVDDLYASVDDSEQVPPSSKTEEVRFVDALHQAHAEAMKRHDNLVVMGQDIADYGGVFKVTEGLMDSFGKDRVRNTPLCESAIIGAAVGLSMRGMKSMVEMQFADFVSCGFNQIVNNLAKLHYRWEQEADVVIRMPTGGGVGAGPFHSQSNEAWFTHVPGLKVVYPSSPHDAKGLLLAAIAEPNPVLFFEHKLLYRSTSGPVPEGYYTEEIGKAKVVQQGDDATIITYGAGVHWAQEAVSELDAEVEIVDLRTLAPIDWDTVVESVQRTGRALILHEDTLTGGLGGEIAAYLGEHCFQHLDAPIMRCGSLDTPVPFNKKLEDNFLAKKRLLPQIKALLEY